MKSKKMNNSTANELNKYINEKQIKDRIMLVNYGGFIDLSVYPNGINSGGRIRIQEESTIGLEYFKAAIAYILKIC